MAPGSPREVSQRDTWGMDEVIVTYLEMRSRPSLTVTRPHRAGMLLRIEEPTTTFYRYLYETIGGRWGWRARMEMTDPELLAIISDPMVDVFVLYFSGVPRVSSEPIGVTDEVELVHFGLAPEFIGRGLGKPLLASAVETAWDESPDRVWVKSSNRDHPRGILTYQWAGFVPYQEARVQE